MDLADALAHLRNAKRIMGPSNSYRKDNPSEYTKVMAYLDGGPRPSGVTTDMGFGLVEVEDVRRAIVVTPPSENVYNVPPAIDGTGSSDVTSALLAWIAGVPNGTSGHQSVLKLGANKTYRIDTSLTLTNRSFLTFDLNGSTLQSNLGPQGAGTGLFWFRPCDHVTVRNGSIIGTYTYPSSGDGLNPTFQYNHGIHTDGSTHITADNLTISDFYGDGVYIGPDWLTNGAADIQVLNCDIRRNGRQGVTVAGATTCLIQGNHFQQTGYFTVDMEPNNFAYAACSGVIINGNTIGSQVGTTVRRVLGVLPSASAAINNVSFTNNVVTGRTAEIWINDGGAHTPWQAAQHIAGLTLTGNTCDTSAANGIWSAIGTTGMTVGANTIPVDSGTVMQLRDNCGYSIVGTTFTEVTACAH